MSCPVALGVEITLNHEDNSCYLTAAGINEQPTVRVETGKPLLSFEKSVFTLVREVGGVATTSNNQQLTFGSVVNLYSPVTKSAAVVLRTEQSDGSVGLRIVMRPLDERSSLFRIQPKFKSRRGDNVVMHGDSVVLMLDNSDLFLCVGEGSRGLEVVATTEPAVWSINRYDRGASQDKHADVVFAGRVLSFFHRLHQTTLVNAAPVVPSERRAQSRRHTLWHAPAPDMLHQETVTARNRHAAILDEPTTDIYFTRSGESADERSELPCGSLWIAENIDPTIGGPLVAGERYRFRHFVSGRYLAIKSVGSAVVDFTTGTISVDDPDMLERSLWDVESSSENEFGHLSAYHSYVRLRHVMTGQWLGACPENDFQVVPALPTLKTHSRDRLLLKHAPKKIEADLFFVMAQLEIVRSFTVYFHSLQDFARSTDRTIMSHQTRAAIDRTNEACLSLVNHVSSTAHHDVDHLALPDAEKQRRMGELGAAELIFNALIAPFQSRGVTPEPPIAGGVFTLSDIQRKEFHIMHGLMRTLCKLLRQVVHESPDNAKAIMPHVHVFLYLESCNINLGPALSSIVSHAPTFHQGDTLRSTVERLFVLNERTRHPRFIEAITAACTTVEAAGIVKDLIKEYPCTLTATVVEVGRLIIHPDGDSDKRMSFDAAMPVEMFIAHGDPLAVTFYNASVRLILMMARCASSGHGGEAVMTFCRDLVSRDEVLLVLSCGFRDAKNLSIADSIKATYTELAAVLYLASDLEASHKPRVMVVSSAAAQPSKGMAIGSGGQEGPFMRQMKLIALETLKANTRQVIEETGRNALLWQSTIVWHMFVRAQLAGPAELHEVIPMLLSTLDGSTDVLSAATEDESWDRYARSEENEVVFNTKVEICHFFRTFFTMRCEDAVAQVVHGISTGAKPDAIQKMARDTFMVSTKSVDMPTLHRVLLDLALYESHELTRASANLLALIVRHEHLIAADVRALHVLSSKHSESYARVVDLASVIQAGHMRRSESHRVAAAYEAIGHLAAVLHSLLGLTSDASELDSTVTSAAAGGIEYLDLLRMWNVHDMVLALLPSPSELPDEFARCTEFLFLFCHSEQNQQFVAPHWATFFDAMEQSPGRLGRSVLQLLTKIWAKGNTVCPAERRDVRFVLTQFQRDETNVDALRALIALLSSGVPAPAQQRDVIVLLQEFDVIGGQWWMTRPPNCVLALTRLLELCCAGNNNFTRRVVQAKFPIGMVLRILAGTNVSRLGFKTALVRFLAIVHFASEDDTPHHQAVQQAKQLVQDESFWRLVRDDFLVRFDEVSTGVKVQRQIKPYILEVSLALDAFFTNRFAMGLSVAKTEWLLKEVRGVLASTCHLVQNIDQLDFTAQEKHVFVALAKSIYRVTSNISDNTVEKLQTLLKNVDIPADSEYVSDDDEMDKEAVLLKEVQALFDANLPDEEHVSDVLLPIVRPINNNDRQCWRRRVLKRLLAASAIQDFEPQAICMVLQLCSRCIETVQKSKALGMQILFEEIGGLKTATVLMDAVSTPIVIDGIKMGIAVIDNGAREVQDNFMDYLESNDEKFFVAMKRCVDKAILELQHWRRLIVQNTTTSFDIRSGSTCFSYVTHVLRFVQLMCEGHHFGMQEYVREQKDNLRSVNALQVALQLLRAILSGDTVPFEEELVQCLELLTEFCQGPCVGNQSLLISANACGTLNTILVDNRKSPEVRLAAVTTLLSLLEGCTDTTVAETILRQVPLATLEKVFVTQTTDEETLQLVFSVGILLRNLSDLVAAKPAMQYPLQHLLKQRKDIGKNTGRIQVERGGLLESVYFRIPPPCTRIGEESKLKLLWNVDRSSHAAKHSSFYELCDDLILELDLMERQQDLMVRVFRRYLPENISERLENTFGHSLGSWILCSVILALASNFFFLVELDALWLVTLLALAQTVVSAAICYIDWTVDGAVYFHKFKKSLQQRQQSKSADYLDVEEVAISKRREYIVKASRGRFRFCVGLLLCAFLALVGQHKLLVVHLFWVITLSPAFANVIAAITQNAKTLSLTIVLGLLFCYSFAIFGFAMFPEDFDNDADVNSHENCNSLLHCFLFITTTGLRQGGGIGDVMRETSWGSDTFVARKMFDFLFFAVMIIVFLNILFGIIIDTFAELRDAKTRKEDDMRLKCFICGIDSHVFDRHGEGFVWHTKHEHNMWQYLYFIYHLRLKDPNDYTGQESYIAQALDFKDFSFFPTRCLSLEGSRKRPGAASSDASEQAHQHAQPDSKMTATDEDGRVTVKLQSEIATQFDNIRTTVRRVLQRNMLVEGNSADAQYRLTRQADGRSVRPALDMATQTHLSESVASLQYELASAETAKARLSQEIDTMKAEMRSQVEELWKLKVSSLNSAELHQNVHVLRTEVKDLQRQLALVTAEKETMMRQNAFLQEEADRLLVANARYQAGDHIKSSSLALDGSRVVSTAADVERELALDRSKLYESLQLSLPPVAGDSPDGDSEYRATSQSPDAAAAAATTEGTSTPSPPRTPTS